MSGPSDIIFPHWCFGVMMNANAMNKWMTSVILALSLIGDGTLHALCTKHIGILQPRIQHAPFSRRVTNGQSSNRLPVQPTSQHAVLSQATTSQSSFSGELNGQNNLITISNSTTTLPLEEISAPSTTILPSLYSVDVRYNRRSPLTYDVSTGRYLDVTQKMESSNHDDAETSKTGHDNGTIFTNMRQFLHHAFVPEGVSNSYYRFMKWRILQRFVNANVHVIGTQSLLLGLRGMQKSNSAVGLGAAAATNWVLKDTLGKVVRMAWASKMGRKFDPDAKRWRFRASLIYALGNGLEVSTYLHPQYFLVLAMLANSCKQMSMLTSSATRNALYNSFKKMEPSSSSSSGGMNVTNNSTSIVNNNRGSGGSENIGDITAKGEAQIAVVDLLGIASGICLSRAVGISVQNVLAVWIILQIMEIFCMYHEMRSIAYKTFNFERMYTVLGELLLEDEDGNAGCKIKDQVTNGIVSNEHQYKFSCIPTPDQIAAKEKVFLPPDHLARRAIAFGSPGRSALDPEELDMLINDVFQGEKYFLVVGQDVKNQRGLSSRVRQWMRRRKTGCGLEIDPQEQCHIVLHADANNLDILKSALALVILRRKLVKKAKEVSSDCDIFPSALRSRDCIDVLRESCRDANAIFPQLLRELTKQGWRPPLRSMLGRVSARAEWTIQKKIRKDDVSSTAVEPKHHLA